MKITDALLGEHAMLYGLFDYTRDTAMVSGDTQEVRTTVAALERLLLAHARAEEELLFPSLEPHLGEMGPLGVMRAEHREIDSLLESARSESDLDALKSLIARLLTLVHGHFRKEEQVLFGLARQYLDDTVLTSLGSQWATRRNVVIDGQGCMGFG